MLAAPGRIRLVALYVRVSTPVNVTIRSAPSAIESNPVMEVVPVMLMKLLNAAPMAGVELDAIVTVGAAFSADVSVPPVNPAPKDARTSATVNWYVNQSPLISLSIHKTSVPSIVTPEGGNGRPCVVGISYAPVDM